MEPQTSLFLTPVIQYGFAGLSIVLISIIVWLIKNLLSVLEKTNSIITDNTAAIRNANKNTSDGIKIMRDVHDKLLSRPCIVKGNT